MEDSPTLRERIDLWCAGRNAWMRAPLVLLLAWAWMRHSGEPSYRSVFGGLNLGVHELGHFVFGPFGDLPGALGGSLLQCILPFVGMVMFARQRDLFAIAFAWGWLGTNLFEVATYAGDAVAMRLPLVTPGGGHAIHDWNYVLGAKGWLRHTEAIEAGLRGAAHVCMAIGACAAAWLLGRMIRMRSTVTEAAMQEIYPRAIDLRPWSEPAVSKVSMPGDVPAAPRMSGPSTSGPRKDAKLRKKRASTSGTLPPA